MAERLSRTELQTRAFFLREWVLTGFLPDSPAGKVHLSMSTPDFNGYVFNYFQSLQASNLSEDEADAQRQALGSHIRAYWGVRLRGYIDACDKGNLPKGMDVDFSHRPTANTLEGLYVRTNPRNTLVIKTKGENGASDTLIIDNPEDTDNFNFKLRTKIGPQGEDEAITEYEIGMAFRWGAKWTKELWVTRAQYSKLSSAPGFWDKVREQIKARRIAKQVVSTIPETHDTSIEGIRTEAANKSELSSQREIKVDMPIQEQEHVSLRTNEIKVSLRESGDELIPINNLTEQFGLSRTRILQLKQDGRVRAVMLGRVWYCSIEDLRRYVSEPKNKGGRPRQASESRPENKTT